MLCAAASLVLSTAARPLDESSDPLPPLSTRLSRDAARLEGEKITDPNQEFTAAADLEGKVLQLGKKTFRRLVG